MDCLHYPDYRELWRVELDIFNCFREICEAHGLKYYAIAGTLLGAVRHSGFIPWDDDMDFAMPFDDYIRFQSIAAKECHYPYELQSSFTDPELGQVSFSRIRRKDTTGCTQWEFDNIVSLEGDVGYNLGIFIDIFPICNIPDDETEMNIQKEQILDVWRAIRGYGAKKAAEMGYKGINAEYFNFIKDYERYSDRYSIGELKELYLKLCGCNKAPTKRIGLTSFRTFDSRSMWDTEWFAETIKLPFEDTTLVAPIGYESVLTKGYGDWRTPVADYAYHELYVYDTHVSYAEKLFS